MQMRQTENPPQNPQSEVEEGLESAGQQLQMPPSPDRMQACRYTAQKTVCKRALAGKAAEKTTSPMIPGPGRCVHFLIRTIRLTFSSSIGRGATRPPDLEVIRGRVIPVCPTVGTDVMGLWYVDGGTVQSGAGKWVRS